MLGFRGLWAMDGPLIWHPKNKRYDDVDVDEWDVNEDFKAVTEYYMHQS